MAPTIPELTKILQQGSAASQAAAEQSLESVLPALHALVNTGAINAFMIAVVSEGGGFDLRSGARNPQNYLDDPRMEHRIEIDKQNLVKHALFLMGLKLGSLPNH